MLGLLAVRILTHELLVLLILIGCVNALVLPKIWCQSVKVPSLITERCPAVVVLFRTTNIPGEYVINFVTRKAQ